MTFLESLIVLGCCCWLILACSHAILMVMQAAGGNIEFHLYPKVGHVRPRHPNFDHQPW